ncbi:MAG: DUF3822 family protein [Marinilabiliaceae bacterium]|nr:DUF3822 family protein [Marinilabiliaceae bacterium]
MGNFSIIDESFDPNLANSYYLSIRLSSNGLAFCTLDPIRNKYIQLSFIVLDNETDLFTQLDKHFANCDILNFPYKKTFVLVPSQIATLIPSGIFDSEKAGTILKFCCNIPDKYSIFFNKIRMADLYNIFAIPQEIENIFKRQFFDPQFVHQYTPVADSFLASTTSLNKSNHVCINFNAGFIDILVFDNERLMSCASFPVNNENELLYYTLFTFEQLKLDKSTTPIVISGADAKCQKYLPKLASYLENIELVDFPSCFRYGMKFKDPKIKGFYDLLYLPSCV